MKFSFSIILFILFSQYAIAQSDPAHSWNYEHYPNISYNLEHLELDLRIVPESAQINGVGSYEISSRRQALHQIILHTADLEILSISSGDSPLDYLINGDSLIISLADTLPQNQKTTIDISWQSESMYGIYKDAFGYVRTSLNPGMLHHWIPVFDHPRMHSTFNIHLVVPAEKEAVVNGKKGDEEILSTNEQKIQWSSDVPVPITGLSLVVGDFEKSEAISGIKGISIYADKNNVLPEVRENLLQSAVRTLRQLERKLSFEYPFETVQVVVLPDHQWDEIQSGAGIIYLYQNLGSLATQLKRGIAGQWLGQYHLYPEQIDKTHDYEFLKMALLGNNDLTDLKNPDSLKSISAWNFWIEQYPNFEDEFLKTIIEQSLPELVKAMKGFVSWNDYANFWYQKTGLYVDEFSANEKETDESDSAIVYEVMYDYDELNSKLTLNFNAQHGKGLSTLVDVQLNEYGFSDSSQSSFSFTGLQDEVELELSPTVEFVTLSLRSDSNIRLEEQKPFLFLINQLRSTTENDRIEAAYGLQNFSDNPDIQLALRDALNGEENAEVKAALLKTMGFIYKGATGTEQTFLNELRSANNAVKKAALHSLGDYPRNEQVANTLLNFLLRSEADSLFNVAILSYKKVTGTTQLLSLAQRLKELDAPREKVLKTLISVAHDSTGQVLMEIAQLTSEDYPYSIREQALKTLFEHQRNEEIWSELLPQLLTSRDSRIRYLALDGLQYLGEDTATELLTNRQKEEFDPRIQKKIEAMKN